MNFACRILNIVLRSWPLLAYLPQSSIMLKSRIYKIANNPPFDFFGKKVVQDVLYFHHFKTWSMCFEFTWCVTQILHNNCDRELTWWNSRKWLLNLLRIMVLKPLWFARIWKQAVRFLFLFLTKWLSFRGLGNNILGWLSKNGYFTFKKDSHWAFLGNAKYDRWAK